MALDFSRCRLPPFQHQREDVEWLIHQPYAFIASEMRTGKSKIVIDAAQFLFEAGTIDRLIIVSPEPVRSVWVNPDFGELQKHLWPDLPARVVEYHDPVRVWTRGYVQQASRFLDIYCTNFEFLRSKNRLIQLLPAAKPSTWLVIDESSFVKNPTALQTKACATLRKRCGRVTLLSGTPIFHSPLDLFSQGNLLHPRILNCPYVTQFKARYAVQQPILGFGGKPITRTITKGRWSKEIVLTEIAGWTNLDDLERRFAPYTVRRLQRDCLDLPPKLDPVTLTATLTESWPAYKSMKQEMLVWLQSGQVVTPATAAIRALRLSQITGGFLGGAEASGVEELFEWDFMEASDDTGRRFINGGSDARVAQRVARGQQADLANIEDPRSPTAGRCDAVDAIEGMTVVGREKLDVLLWFIERQLEADPNLHLVAWSRFRAEAFRAEREVTQRFPQFETAVLLGGQKKAERQRALALLKPETSPTGPVFIAGIEGTGSFGLDMTAAHTCVTMSSGYSPGRSAQTLDRVYGPGQTHPIAYFNIIAVGPKGQKTIDADILQARTTGEQIAQRTAAAWVRVLKEE